MPQSPGARRFDPQLLGWGGFFVGLGLVPLAVAFGATLPFAPGQLVQYWPVLLILVGIWLLLSWTAFGALGGLVIGLAIGLVVGTFLAGPGIGGPACALGGRGPVEGARSGTFASAAQVDLDVGCGALDVLTGPGLGWSVEGLPAQAAGAMTSDPASLRVQLPRAGGTDVGLAVPLTVTLPADDQLDLTATHRFGSLGVHLSGAHLGRLTFRSDFSSVQIDLTGATLRGPLDVRSTFGSATLTLPATSFSGSVRSDFGSLHVCLPATLAAQVTVHSSFGSVAVSAAAAADPMTQEGNVWQSSDYATASTRIRLDLQASFGSIDVRRGGC
ncbi:MAG: hypothetical protein ACRDGL_01235 [Candidatus Limnocylindrales bacterium]